MMLNVCWMVCWSNMFLLVRAENTKVCPEMQHHLVWIPSHVKTHFSSLSLSSTFLPNFTASPSRFHTHFSLFLCLYLSHTHIVKDFHNISLSLSLIFRCTHSISSSHLSLSLLFIPFTHILSFINGSFPASLTLFTFFNTVDSIKIADV